MIRVKPVRQTGSFNKCSEVHGIAMMVKSVLKDASRRLSFLFWFIFWHSFFIGLALVLHPAGIMKRVGYHPVSEEFFPVQGGVFLILLSILYLFVALRLEGCASLVVFSIIVKWSGFAFLIFYYFFIDGIPLVLVSGIVDGAMAVAILLAYRSYNKQESKYYTPDEKEQRNDDFWYY